MSWYNVQLSSVTQSHPTLCKPMGCSTPGFPVHHQLLKPTQTHVPHIGDVIQPFHPLLSPLPPTSIFSSIRVFSNGLVLRIRWPKYWSFSFSISPSNVYSGLISFRMDWLVCLQSKGISRGFSNTTAQKHLMDSVGEGEGGNIWENAIETCKYHVWNELPVQVRGTILDAWGWCTGTTQRDGMGREEGGGFRMGNTCIPVAD